MHRGSVESSPLATPCLLPPLVHTRHLFSFTAVVQGQIRQRKYSRSEIALHAIQGRPVRSTLQRLLLLRS
eukprot:scaffold840_cov344-Pavlova_lutheri.AAC.129